MYGYPKLIETKHDVDVMIDYFKDPAPPAGDIDRAVAFFQGLIDGAQSYVFDRNLADGEAPGPEPEYIVLVQEDGARRQEVLSDDPAARLYQLGYTVAEAQAYIDQLKGLK